MGPLRLRSVAAAITAACAATTGCGATPPPASRPAGVRTTSPAPTSPAPTSTRPAAPGPAGARTCGPFPPRHAWVEAVSADGHEEWRTSLPTGKESGAESLAPLVRDGLVVAAQDGTVTTLDAAGGSVRWSRTEGQSIGGLWAAGHAVVALVDPVFGHGFLVALELRTGRQLWRDAVRPGILGTAAPLPDGRLAWVGQNGTLHVVRLSDGAQLWSHQAAPSPALGEASGQLVFAAGSTLTGYDEATGATSWQVGGLPALPALTAAAGLALVSSSVSGGSAPTAVTAVDPATGSVRWHVDTGAALQVLGIGGGRVLVNDMLNRRLLLFDAGSGHLLWSAHTAVQFSVPPLLQPDRVVTAEGGTVDQPATRLVARSPATGRVLWAAQLPGLLAGSRPLLPVAGTVVVAAPARRSPAATLTAYDAATGRRLWTTGMPALVQAPPVTSGSSIIVQAADPAYGCAL